MISRKHRPHFTPGNDAVPILQEAGWAPGPVWTGGKSSPPGFCFVHYDFIQCSMVVYTRDTMETRNLVVMSYCLLCSVVCSLGNCVTSWTSTLSGSICDVAVRHSHILIVARGFGMWASACRHVVSSTRSHYVLTMGSSHSCL